MEKRTLTLDKGVIEIENSYVKCFLGKNRNLKSSEDIYKELENDAIIKKNEDIYYLGEEAYTIVYPIQEKNISIITSEGKKYKSTIYFIDDIINIISAFKMTNPSYYSENKYESFNSKDDYIIFLYEKKTNEIKDIGINTINEKELQTIYDQFQIKETIKLRDINKNINLYSKIDNIENEDFFITSQRNILQSKLNIFCRNNKRNEINDIIYGIFGNYASGKSFFLMNFNYKSEFSTIYLNFKILKNASNTQGFTDILNNEIMILFHKLKKSFKDFKNFISKYLNYSKSTETLILSIINDLKNENVIIILDQYQNQKDKFSSNNFITKLKEILFEKGSKIKVIISSSINDSPIRTTYLDYILDNTNKFEEENINQTNKNNDYIPYHFVQKLVNESEIKNYIKDINKQDDKEFNDTLKLLNYLPLYYNLCKQQKNLKIFKENTMKKIEKKISEYRNKEKIDLKFLDNIRKMIDNEITCEQLNIFGQYIPFKYFYIEKFDGKFILRTHFPLINEIWINIIMKETVELFDGEIKYNGNIIGSLLELNIIINIKDKNIPLDIDSFCKVDTISGLNNIIEKDTDDFTNKNIFITQKNQNGPNFDFAYIQGKNKKTVKISYIQVKKSYSNNRVDLQTTMQIFEKQKKNFSTSFGFIPDECNLIYISLINNEIKQAIISHDIYKKDKSKKIFELEKDTNSIVYSTNKLINFCNENYIQLYYYEPSTHYFYIKDNDKFKKTELDLFKKKEKNFPFTLNYSYLENIFKINQKECLNINNEYYNIFLSKKRKKTEKFHYMIKDLDLGIVFEFAKDYFKDVKIINFMDLRKNHYLDFDYYSLTKKQAMVSIKVIDENQYQINSLIYNKKIFKIENDEFKLILNKLDENIDFIVVISFDSILDNKNILFK